LFEIITLDGRKFIKGFPHDPDVATQIDYIQAHLRLAGVEKIFNDLDGVQRTKERRPEDMLTQILLSGRTYFILAGFLTEVGKVWSRAEADANAARLAAITDDEEKKAMRASVRDLLIGIGGPEGTAPEIVRKLRTAN
jgi:hypothetical protein